MNFVRTGMMAHMNISGALEAEREEAALMLAHMLNDTPPVAATRIGNTRVYQTHYMADVKVRYLRCVPKHTMLRTTY